MTFTTENPAQSFVIIDEHDNYDGDARDAMWRAFNDAPLNSVVATGFRDDGLIYFEKTSVEQFEWTVVQVDESLTATFSGDEVMEEILTPGYVETMDSAVIDAGGDIDVAYVIRVGA